jgi:hypothetical protein
LEEWTYVTSKIQGDKSSRDQNNVGKTPSDFLTSVNAHVSERRSRGIGALLSEKHAMLSLDEVLAVRLYSGPAYQPLNVFLRQIAVLSGIHRVHLAQSPSLTFTATVATLCSAIRKLAAVATSEEATQPLWRGVRGELPRSFWLPDETGTICAVDLAFMSTSSGRQAPISFMSPGSANVLWKISPQQETDDGFHYGANIEMLSQYSAEKEILFPPCTMLKLTKVPSGTDPLSTIEELAVSEGDKNFTSVPVLPVFL